MEALKSRQRSSDQDPATHRVVRILRIIRMIEGEPETWTRRALAEHFKVSNRTMDNDLRVLRLAGAHLCRSRRGYAILTWEQDQ